MRKVKIRLLRIPSIKPEPGQQCAVPVSVLFHRRAALGQPFRPERIGREPFCYFLFGGNVKIVFHKFLVARRAGSVKGGPFSVLVKKVDRRYIYIYTYIHTKKYLTGGDVQWPGRLALSADNKHFLRHQQDVSVRNVGVK